MARRTATKQSRRSRRGEMTAEARYECACGTSTPVDTALWRCPRCNGPLLLSRGTGLTRGQIRTDVASLWRYGAAIRVPGPRGTLGEGLTPLVPGEVNGRPVRFTLV